MRFVVIGVNVMCSGDRSAICVAICRDEAEASKLASELNDVIERHEEESDGD